MTLQRLLRFLIVVAMMTAGGIGSAVAADPVGGTVTVESVTDATVGETVTLAVTMTDATDFGALEVYVDNISTVDLATIRVNATNTPLLDRGGLGSIGAGVGKYKGLSTINWISVQGITQESLILFYIDVTPKVPQATIPVNLIFEVLGTCEEVDLLPVYTVINGTVTTAEAPGPVASSVTITAPLDNAEIAVGTTGTATADALDASGDIIPGADIAWSSSNSGVLGIDANGDYTAVAQGTATLTAVSGDASKSVTVTVIATEPVASSVTITTPLNNAEIAVGTTGTATADVLDASSGIIPGADIAWSSSNSDILEIDVGGDYTAVAQGTTTLTAVSGEVSASVTVTVFAAEPVAASVTIIAPLDNAEIAVGTTGTATADVFDASGGIIPRADVAWSSSNSGVLEIDAGGDYTAVTQGTATLTAVSGEASTSVTVTVFAAEQEFAGGAGTETSPYQIATANQLNNTRNHLDAHYVLTDDIDLSGYETWTPITPFTGTFDGAGHTISNLTITVIANAPSGLFGTVSDATIKNVHLSDGTITTSYYNTGVLAGSTSGNTQIVDVSVRGVDIFINGYGSDAGGLVGKADGNTIISRCSVDANITVTATNAGPGGRLGGITGSLTSGNSGTATIEDCIATGTIISSGGSIGGLAAELKSSDAKIIHSISAVSIDAPAGTLKNYGGLVGVTRGSVSRSVALNEYINSGDAASTGRIAGALTVTGSSGAGTVTDSYAWVGMNNSRSSFGAVNGNPATAELWNNFEIYENLGFDDTVWAPGSGNCLIPVLIGHPAMDVDVSYLSADISYPVSVTISGLPETLAYGATGTASAVIYSNKGTQMPEAPIAWSSNNTAVLGINADGTYTAVSAGSARITAAADGATTFVDVIATAPAFPAGGDGSVADPYRIATVADLNNVRAVPSAHYILTNNIDLVEYGNWNPIGSSSIKFTGTFDGAGHTIDNLTIASSSSHQGLFGYVSGSTIISNVTLVNASVTTTASGSVYAGTLVGQGDGGSTIRNISVRDSTVAVTGNYAGGIAGSIITVSSSSFTGDVTGDQRLGGIAGMATNIDNCIAAGTVTSTSTSPTATVRVGGIVGQVSGSGIISNSIVLATVSANGKYVGGIAGQAGSSVSNSVALNPYVNSSATANVGQIGGYGSSIGTTSYAWDGMQNAVGTFSFANGAGTPAASEQVWGNATFYDDLGFTAANGWTMGISDTYKLPYPTTHSAIDVDASYLQGEPTPEPGGDAPVTNFTANVIAGPAPLTVAFTDLSTGATTWAWDFENDGISDSSEQNPVHTYTTPGVYTVTLTTTNDTGSDTLTRYRYISVRDAPSEPARNETGYPLHDNGTTVTTVGGQQQVTFNATASNGTVSGNDIHLTTGTLNVAIQTDGLTAEGGNQTGNVIGVLLESSEPLTAALDSVGNVSIAFNASMNTYNPNLTISTSIYDQPSAGASTAFTLAAADGNLEITSTAYAVYFTKENLGENDTISNAVLQMTVSPAWVEANGGVAAIRVFRQGDDGIVSILATTYLGLDNNGMMVFEAISPDGFSSFAVAATKTVTTPTQPPARGGGGGGGGSASPTTSTGTADLLTASWGGVLRPYLVYVDGMFAHLSLETGVTALDDAGNPLSGVGIAPASTLPGASSLAFSGYAVDCSPTGATFSPAIDLVFSFTEAEWATLLDGADGDAARLVVQGYDTATGAWAPCPTNANAAARTVTASVSHFSTYALFIGTATETPVTTGPTETATTPTSAATTAPVPPVETGEFPLIWIALAVLIVAAIIGYVVWKRQ